MSRLAARAIARACGRSFPAMLAIWAAQAAGQPTQLSFEAASAWLGLYIAAKILDDVQDGDASFAGEDVPTQTAINLGVALLFASQRIMVGGPTQPSEPTLRLALLREVAAVSLAVTQGQQSSWETTEDADPLESAWVAASAKAGLPLCLACRLGATSVRAPKRVVDGLGEFGRLLGEALQAMDDASGVMARDFADLRLGSGSLAVAYGLSVAEGRDRDELNHWLGTCRAGNGTAAARTYELLEGMGCLRYLGIEASARLRRARAALDGMADWLSDDGLAALRAVADSVDPARA